MTVRSPPPPRGIAQEAVSTKAQRENWLVSGLQDQRCRSVTRGTYDASGLTTNRHRKQQGAAVGQRLPPDCYYWTYNGELRPPLPPRLLDKGAYRPQNDDGRHPPESLWRSRQYFMCVYMYFKGADWTGGGGGWHKASVSDCLPLAAPIGLSPLLILTLRGPERVLVVSTEPPDDLSCLTTPGVGCPGDGLLPMPLTRCIPMHTPSPCGGLPTPALT